MRSSSFAILPADLRRATVSVTKPFDGVEAMPLGLRQRYLLDFSHKFVCAHTARLSEQDASIGGGATPLSVTALRNALRAHSDDRVRSFLAAAAIAAAKPRSARNLIVSS
jgi:hypothetical protein